MFNYDRNLVAAAYKFENPDKSTVSEQALLNYDAALYAGLNNQIMLQAPKAEIPVDRFSLSMLMLFAVGSTGNGAKLKVKRACQYFESVRPQVPVNQNWMDPTVVAAIESDDEEESD